MKVAEFEENIKKFSEIQNYAPFVTFFFISWLGNTRQATKTWRFSHLALTVVAWSEKMLLSQLTRWKQFNFLVIIPIKWKKMSNTQGAELTVRELLQKRDVNDGDTQRADGCIYQAVVDSQKNAKIVEWVEIRSERTDAQEFKHTCLSAASIVVCLVVIILLYFVVKAINK